MQSFDLSGVLRRIRRLADLSQRELARACGLSQSAVAQAESGRRDLPVRALVRAAEHAGLRLALVDAHGREVAGMAADAVRDRYGRRFPAHLDTHFSDERWGRYEHRRDRSLPWFAVDLDRGARDALRDLLGTPDDHHPIRTGDSPQERRARRQEAARQRRQEDRRRRLDAAGPPVPDEFACSCPPSCEEVDDGCGRPVHVPECSCGCDLG